MSSLVQTALLVNALTGAGAATLKNTTKQIAVTVEWGAGTSAGSVILETAPNKDYTGTWSNLTTFTWATASTIDTFRGSVPGGIAVRARIGTTVVTADKGVTVVLDEN